MNAQFRILMVEDILRYHQLFADEIQAAMAAEVDFCTSGEQALEILHTDPRKYHLLLLDLNLPGRNGRDVLSELRANAAFDDLPIIILTGNTHHQLQSQLFSEGANEFIEKGAPPEVLVARLKAQVKHKLALDRLTQLAVDRESFAAGVLHDIRNIEMNLFAACELIEMQVKSDPVKHQAQILEDLHSFKGQIRRIDTYATSVLRKVREGSSQLTLENTSIAETLNWVTDFLKGQTANLSLDMKDSGSWDDVSADKYLLRSALLNIIQNTIKYARPNVSPSIQVAQTRRDDMAVIEFRDNGIGIPPANLRKVFEPFFRAHQVHDENSYGLGLSMVANVVGKMSGRVWAEVPQDGQPGTVFFIELPLAA